MKNNIIENTQEILTNSLFTSIEKWGELLNTEIKDFIENGSGNISKIGIIDLQDMTKNLFDTLSILSEVKMNKKNDLITKNNNQTMVFNSDQKQQLKINSFEIIENYIGYLSDDIEDLQSENRKNKSIENYHCRLQDVKNHLKTILVQLDLLEQIGA